MEVPRGSTLLTSARQIAAVASPFRQELLERLSLAKTASVRELARQLGKPVTAVHYHVNLLVRAGIVAMAGTRREGRGRPEALYNLTAESFAVASGPGQASRSAARTMGATVRLSLREAQRGLRDADIRGSGEGRNLHVRRHRAFLTRAELREVNRLLDLLEAQFEKAGARPRRARDRDGQTVALTFVLAPSSHPNNGS